MFCRTVDCLRQLSHRCLKHALAGLMVVVFWQLWPGKWCLVTAKHWFGDEGTDLARVGGKRITFLLTCLWAVSVALVALGWEKKRLGYLMRPDWDGLELQTKSSRGRGSRVESTRWRSTQQPQSRHEITSLVSLRFPLRAASVLQLASVCVPLQIVARDFHFNGRGLSNIIGQRHPQKLAMFKQRWRILYFWIFAASIN